MADQQKQSLLQVNNSFDMKFESKDSQIESTDSFQQHIYNAKDGKQQNDRKSVVDYEIDGDLNEPQFILYAYRWVCLASYCMAQCGFGMALVTVTTIVTTVENVYQIDEIIVYMGIYAIEFLFIPGNIASMKILDKYGLRVCLAASSLFVVVGASVRVIIIWTNYWPALAGQIIIAGLYASFKNTPTKIACIWFGDNERGLATALGTVSSAIGLLIGLILPNLLISNDDTIPDDTHRQAGHKHFSTYIAVQTIIIVVLMVPSIFLVKNKPPSPPSVIATKPRPQFSIWEGIKQLCKNTNYILLFISYQCQFGIYSCIGGIVSSWTKPYHFGVEDNTMIAICFLISGILGSFIYGGLIDKYKCFKKLMIFIGLSNIVTLIICYLSLEHGNKLAVAAVVCVMGANMFPVSLVTYQLAAEITYPINEVLSIGVLNIWGQIFAIIFSYISLAVMDDTVSALNCFIFWVVLAILGVIPAFFVKEDLRRLNMKEVRNSRYIEEDDLKQQTKQERQEYVHSKNIIAHQSIRELLANTDDLKSVKIIDYDNDEYNENNLRLKSKQISTRLQ